MQYKKYIIASLSFVFSFTYSSFCQNVAETISIAVKEGEQIWNATSPDKSFMSEGNTIAYGLGYLKAGNYTAASWSFDELLTKNKDNAFANYFMGCVRMGLHDTEGAQKFFDKAVQLNNRLKNSVPDVVGRQNKLPVTIAKEPSQSPIITNNSNNQNSTASSGQQQGLNHFKVGDKVEVVHAGGWWPGVVKKVEGEDKGVYVTVEYTFQKNSKYSALFYNGIRPATGQTTSLEEDQNAGGSLVYGDYTLSRGLGLSTTPSGYFTLYANGRYRYFDVWGTYTYNSANGVIVWESGTFNNWGKNKSTFTKGKRVSQIDMTYIQKSGPLYYSAGHNN